MVGDRKHDMVEALANRIHPAGVTWGYGARSELLEAGAARLLDTPDELAILEAKGWIPLVC